VVVPVTVLGELHAAAVPLVTDENTSTASWAMTIPLECVVDGDPAVPPLKVHALLVSIFDIGAVC
jgi:hypothetical protein